MKAEARQANDEPIGQVLTSRTEAWLQAGWAERVVSWQRRHGRHGLPWQMTRDPYRVWLSEIMLQQTQVATVLAYYTRFLQAFPTVAALAAAPLNEVLSLWAGLGYYSRARNLHRCAQIIMREYAGEFPMQAAELVTLPGIGPSTAAAIAAFCFGERAAILDGNVKRVLARALGYSQDLAEKKHERALWAAASTLLPEHADAMPVYTQALMDLGATVCTRGQPACVSCPVQTGCFAYLAGQPQAYPVKSRKLKRTQRESWWLWVEWGEKIWLQQRPEAGVWAGLWSLPLFESMAQLHEAVSTLATDMGILIDEYALQPQPLIKHVLTHFDWYLHVYRWQLPLVCRESNQVALDERHWVAHDQLAQYGLPAPLKRLLSI